MVSAGMDFEKPRPLQVLVGVRTSVTTGFFSMAEWIQTYGDSLKATIQSVYLFYNLNAVSAPIN